MYRRVIVSIRSVGHLLQQSCLLAEAFNGLLVLLNGELHVSNDAVIAFLLLIEDFFQAKQNFL